MEVRDRRLNAGYTPEGLGHEINISGRTIRRIEDGARPTVRTMFALAHFFDMEVTELWL
jgi:DNA-binding XRE family transcriptional regulator